MKAKLLLLAPLSLLASCAPVVNQQAPPAAPVVDGVNPYGVPDAGGYQQVDPINPPAIPVPTDPSLPTPNYDLPIPPAPPADLSLNGNAYTIEKGDSLWGISRKFGTSVEELKSLNGLTNNTIIAGRTLIIPSR